MSVYAYRKCVKCGARPTETLRLHRFPKPGTTNILRATAWATYCWPDKNWSSLNSLSSLHEKSKFLCGQHFEDSCYTDNNKTRLSRYSVPGKKEDVIQTMHSLRSKLSIPAIVLQVNSQPDSAVAECSTDPVIPGERAPLRNAAEQATVKDLGNGSAQTTDVGLHKGEPHIDHAYVVPPKLISEPYEVPGEKHTLGVTNGVLADDVLAGEVIAEYVLADDVLAEDFTADDVPYRDPSPVPEVEDPAEKSLFSWQKADLIEADDPDDPPVRAPPPPAAPTLALTCDSDPGVATQDQAVPTLPAPAEKDVENHCKDCGELNEGFWFWCVECSCGALCGACAGRPPHHRHHVLRTPMHADTTRTRAVLMVIRQQLLNENLLSQHETVDDGLKVEVKEEPAEPPAEPDPLACEPHDAIQHQCIAEPIVDHPQPLKLPQLPVAHAHRQKLILSTQRKLFKVSPTVVKRAFLSHLDRIVTTQQQVKGPQTTSQSCKENLITQPSKAREYQVPKRLLKPLTSSPSKTAGNVTGITRHNQATTQAPIKVTSEPQPSETVIIDLDEDETVEYLQEGLDSDIEMVEEVVLDDNETSEDDDRETNEDDALDDRETNEDDDGLDDHVTNEDDALDDRETNEDDALDDRETNEDDDGLDDRDDDVLDEDYLVDEDDLSEDDESDEDTNGNIDRKGVKRKIDAKPTLPVRRPSKSIIREDDLIEDDPSDEDPIVNIADRGVKRKEDVEETSPVRGLYGSMAGALQSKAVVQVRPLTSLEIRNWTADRKRHRKY